MTTAEMLTHVRMLLDESSASFWGDSDIYLALTNGQKAIVSYLANSKKHDLLRPLAKTTNYNYNQLTIPSDYFIFISCRVNGTTNVMLRTGDIYAKQANSYLAGSSVNPFMYPRGGYFVFEPTLSTGTYDIQYYSVPADIALGVNPTLSAMTHDAMCQYAFAELLLRDTKHQESALEFKKFTDMVSIL